MTKENPLGKVTVKLFDGRERVDSLFRVSLKAFIYNEAGEILVVKEEDKDWDAPGGGMEHGDDFRTALERELKEEIDYDGDFSFRMIGVEEPEYLTNIDCYQLWIGLEVTLKEPYEPKCGVDAKAIRYIDPEELRNSNDFQTRLIYGLYRKSRKGE